MKKLITYLFVFSLVLLSTSYSYCYDPILEQIKNRNKEKIDREKGPGATGAKYARVSPATTVLLYSPYNVKTMVIREWELAITSFTETEYYYNDMFFEVAIERKYKNIQYERMGLPSAGEKYVVVSYDLEVNGEVEHFLAVDDTNLAFNTSNTMMNVVGPAILGYFRGDFPLRTRIPIAVFIGHPNENNKRYEISDVVIGGFPGGNGSTLIEKLATGATHEVILLDSNLDNKAISGKLDEIQNGLTSNKGILRRIYYYIRKLFYVRRTPIRIRRNPRIRHRQGR